MAAASVPPNRRHQSADTAVGMSLWAVFAVVVALIALSLYFLFRRKLKYLSDDELRFHDISPNIRVLKAIPEPARAQIKDAFLRGPDFWWMTFGNAAVSRDDPAAQEKHREVTRYMVECVIRAGERYGHVLAYHDEDGSIIGTCVVVPPYPGWLWSIHFLAAVIPLGKPVPHLMGTGPSERFDAFTSGVEHHHKEFEEDHWHVLNLGVIDGAQGKGVGKQLIEAVHLLAGKVPSYLECHEGNEQFYINRGYVRHRTMSLKPDIKDPSVDSAPFTFLSMVHRPA